MFIITIVIFIPMQDRLAETQPMAGFSSLNEYESGMGKSEIEFKKYFLRAVYLLI